MSIEELFEENIYKVNMNNFISCSCGVLDRTFFITHRLDKNYYRADDYFIYLRTKNDGLLNGNNLK